MYIHPEDVLNREGNILSVLDGSGRTLALIALGDEKIGKKGVPMGPVLPERIIFQLEKGHVSLTAQVSRNELVSDSTL